MCVSHSGDPKFTVRGGRIEMSRPDERLGRLRPNFQENWNKTILIMYCEVQITMRRRRLSFYTRRKLNHRFLQGEFLSPMRFVRFLKKHGISIDEKTLEKYESEGWIQPAFRLVIPEQLQSGTLFLANDNIRKLRKDRLIQ